MEEKTYVIGDETFTREELIKFGKKHYPKFYWITRGVGIGLMLIGTISALIFVAILFSEKSFFDNSPYRGFDDPSNLTAYYIVVSIFAFIAFVGMILFISSFVRKVPEENYLKHAIAYYTKLDTNNRERLARIRVNEEKADATKAEKDKKDVSDLLKYKELLDAGIITQEEFDEKKKEYLG